MSDAELTTAVPTLILVRATIHLDGLACGECAFVDSSGQYIIDCMASGYLVCIPADEGRVS